MMNSYERFEWNSKEGGWSENSKAEVPQFLSDSRNEMILQRIQDSLERNESEIKLIQNVQNSWITKISKDIETLRDRVIFMENQISCCKKKYEIIDEAVRIPGTPDMTIGEGVAANRRALARTLNLIANKAEADDIGKATSQLQLEFSQKIEKVSTHVIIVEKLNQAILALGSRLDVLGLDMQNKVDKSMFSTLASEAEIVRNYSTFVHGAEKSIISLQTNSEKLQKDLVSQSESIKCLADRAMEIQTGINQMPHGDDLRSLRADIHSMIQGLEVKIHEKIHQLEQKQLQSDGSINSVEKNTLTLFAAHETLTKHITKKFEETYKRTHVDHLLEKYLQVDAFLDAIQQVVHDVESKASEASVKDLETKLRNVKDEHELTRKKTDLAAQFIEWYTRNFNLDDSPRS